MNKPRLLGLASISLGSLLLVVPSLVSAFTFNTGESINVYCEQNKVLIGVSFTNNEQTDSLNVTAKDSTSNNSTDLGTVPPNGSTYGGTIVTGLASVGAGNVAFTITSASNPSNSDVRTLTYQSVSCNGQITPTPTITVIPTLTVTPTAIPTQGVTPIPTQGTTPTPTVTPTDTPTDTPTVTPTSTLTITPTSTPDDSGSGGNDCDNEQSNNSGSVNNNCNNNGNNQNQSQTQNNNQTVNVTVPAAPQVLGSSNASNLPSTGTPLQDLLMLGGMFPTGLFLRRFKK